MYTVIECPYCGSDCAIDKETSAGDSLECEDLQCPIVEFKVFDK